MNIALLITLLISIESGGNDSAIGDGGKAYGCLQIHAGAVADYNRLTGSSITHADCFDREVSIAVFKAYVGHYATFKRLGRKPTMEDAARIWNGGPNGYKKACTLPYAGKLHKKLSEINGPAGL